MIKRIVKLLIALVFRGVERIGALLRKENDKPGACVVLAYHDVTAAKYHRFVWQMDRLAQLATPVATDSIRELQKCRNYVAVTFDDGFASTIELVLPLLMHKAIPVTFFIPTAYLGKEAVWIANMERRQSVGRIINAESLKSLGRHNYVTIGSHGINHRRLTEMKDHEVRAEFAESKRLLENITGKKVEVYGFPFGVYNNNHIIMARKADYGNVFTMDPSVTIGVNNEFVIGRIGVDPTDWSLEFILKIQGAYRWQPYVSRLKERLRGRIPVVGQPEHENKL